MKKLLFVLSMIAIMIAFSCERERCYICTTTTDANTTLEASTTEEVCDVPILQYEKEHSSVTMKSVNGGPVYYSQTITKCREK